jgi:hypothetical protein
VLLIQAFRVEPRWKRLGLAGLGAVAGFVAGSPFALLAPRSFFAGAQRLAGLTFDSWSSIPYRILFPFRIPLHYAMGAPLLAISLCAWIGIALRRRRGDWIWLLWPAVFFAGVCRAGTITSTGRVLVALPPVIVLASRGLLVDGPVRSWPRLQRFLPILMVFLVGYTLSRSLCVLAAHRRAPSQKQASE